MSTSVCPEPLSPSARRPPDPACRTERKPQRVGLRRKKGGAGKQADEMETRGLSHQVQRAGWRLCPTWKLSCAPAGPLSTPGLLKTARMLKAQTQTKAEPESPIKPVRFLHYLFLFPTPRTVMAPLWYQQWGCESGQRQVEILSLRPT